MATPTLLLPFEGSLAARDTNGALTATGTGVTYTEGKVASTQAAVLGGGVGVDVAGVAGRLDHAEGALAIRLRVRTAIPSSQATLFVAGNSGSGAYITCYQQNTDGALVYFTRTNGVNTALRLLPALSADVWTDLLFEWDATAIATYGPTGLIATQVRTGSPSTTWATDVIRVGNSVGVTADMDVDSVMVLDTRPAQDERDALFAASVWTWDVLAPSASRTIHPVLKIGSSHIGPMRVGERN